jgi:hypothetical protein
MVAMVPFTTFTPSTPRRSGPSEAEAQGVEPFRGSSFGLT